MCEGLEGLPTKEKPIITIILALLMVKYGSLLGEEFSLPSL